MIVIVIIGILSAVGMVMFGDQAEKAKIAASKANHKQVVKFIYVSVTSCQLGVQLILKYSYDVNTQKFKYTSDLCPYVLASNAAKMQSAFSNHFNSPVWCNPYGLKHASGTCQEAVANGGSVGNGKLGETQIISSGTSLIIDTKVKDGEVLNNTIKLQ